MRIEPYNPYHLDGVVRLSLRAWAPVFESIREALAPEIYQEFYPDWRECQRKAVEEVCASKEMNVWVAVDEANVAGFVAVRMHEGTPKMGEIYMIAVDPDRQRRGIATSLTDFALQWIKDAGATIAMVETGSDPGHAPARRTYEKMGFGLFPASRYFKKL